MANVGEVLYLRGQENDSDIWDDTALIKAYDDAVKVMKAKLAAEQGDDEQSTAQEQSLRNKPKKNKKKHRNKKKDKTAAPQKSSSEWTEGDHCRAVFGDDGQVYEGVIMSIDKTSDTCVVKYLGYGNEEVQHLSDLMAPGSQASSPVRKRTDSQADAQSDGDTSMEWRGGTSPRPGSRSSSVTSSVRSSVGRGHSHHPPRSPRNYNSFMPPPPTAFPFMPPMFPSFPGWPGSSSLPGCLPQVPPPPPIPDDLPEDDMEALHSMLIAWYMSGYHTGYYQGMKNAKKKTQVSPTPSQKRDSHSKK